MRVGFGTTALSKGIRQNHLDGIGVYCNAVLNEYNSNKLLEVTPVSFNVESEGRLKRERSITGSFTLHAAYSIISGKPFVCEEKICKGLDIFHATDHRIPKLSNIPVVATVMDMIPFSHPEWVSKSLRSLKNYAFKSSMYWADHIITISEHSKNDIVNILGIDESSVSVIPLGVDVRYLERIEDSKKNQVKKKYNISDNFFLFVGTLQPRKNIERILQAHRILPKGIRERYPLVIVGKNGWGTEALLPELAKAEMEGYGKWLDCVGNNDLIALMQSATALVYPSLYEGFGLPILEGFAADIPVISSNTTSIPEVAGDAALLVDPLDIDEISGAMQKIVEDGQLSEHLIMKGREMLKNYSWNDCAIKTSEVYKKIIS